MSLLEESKRWHNDATALIKSSELMNLLKKFGEASFSGSYAYNLMLDSDIDLFVANKNPTRKLADEMVIALIRSGYWTSLMYCDWTTNEPPGPYFCVKRDFRGHRWKVDIMMTTPDKISELLPAREIYYHLSDAQKEAIFEIKAARSKGLSSKDIETVRIYDAVLKNNIRGVDNFKRYLEKHSK